MANITLEQLRRFYQLGSDIHTTYMAPNKDLIFHSISNIALRG